MKGTEWEGLPILSAAAPFKAGGRGGPDYYTDVPAGADRDQERRRPLPLSQHHPGGGDHRRAGQGMARDARPASSTRSKPGKADQPLINPDFPSYNFDVIDGVTYKIDLYAAAEIRRRRQASSNADANRIVDLHVRRQADRSGSRSSSSPPTITAPAAAAISRASTRSKIIFEAPDTNRDVIVRYIVEQKAPSTHRPTATGRSRRSPARRVLFETGPKAEDFIADVTAVKIEAGRRDGEAGFAHLPHHALTADRPPERPPSLRQSPASATGGQAL